MKKIKYLRLGLLLTILCSSSVVLAADDSLRKPKAPPPTVSDVVLQIRQASGETRAIEEAKQLLNQELPAAATTDGKIDFLVRRAAAADETGNLQQRLADLKQVADLSRGARNEAQQLYNYGLAELLYGDLLSGEAALQRSLEQIQKGTQNLLILETQIHAVFSYVYVLKGLTAQATDSLIKAKSLLASFKARPGGWWALIPVVESLTYLSEGRLQVTQGKWREAEAALRYAVAQGDETARNLDRLTVLSKNASMQSSLLAGRNIYASELAEHLMREGKLDEAELTVRDILSTNLQRVGRYSIRTALMVIQMAEVMNARGRHPEALQLLAEVEEIGRVLGIGQRNRISLGAIQAKLNALLGKDDWQGSVMAEDSFRQRVDAAQGFGEFDLFSPALGIALVKSARAEEAKTRLERLLAKLINAMGEDHYQVAEARGVMAIALAATGNRKAALAEFEAASRKLIDHASQEDDAQSLSLNTMVRHHILEAYLDTLSQSSEVLDAAAQAFRIADALHGGKTQQALAKSAARAAALEPGLGELIRLDQDSQAEQVSLYRELFRLAGLPKDVQLPQVMADMRQRISVIDKERRERRSTLEKRFPAYANLVSPKPPTLQQAREVLKPGEALINIFSTDQATYVWAFKAQGEIGFTRVSLTRGAINQLVSTLRKAVDPGDVDIARGLPVFKVDEAYSLYEKLLLPAANAWKGADSLLVVANGSLSQLPLAMLPTARITLGANSGVRYSMYDKVPWLIRETAITQLPTVNSLVTLRRLPPGNPKRRAFIGFGDPDFSGNIVATRAPTRGLRNLAVPQFSAPEVVSQKNNESRPPNWLPYDRIPALPDTRDEILELAKILNADSNLDVYLGRAASKEKLKQIDLSQRKVVAFATHGLLPGEFPGVDQPALALANPGNGQHGLLTLEEILGLKLDADWVILSACNTAAGDGLGAEAVSGLGRGFFYAGTRSLLATHWPVESASARLLVTGTFSKQAADPSISRAHALRHSMLTLMRQTSEEDNFSYAHPLFWAPYALIGDGG